MEPTPALPASVPSRLSAGQEPSSSPAMTSRGAARPNGQSQASKICQFKLVLLGESAVGKSSLVLRFVKGQFHEYQESTIGGESLGGAVCRLHRGWSCAPAAAASICASCRLPSPAPSIPGGRAVMGWALGGSGVMLTSSSLPAAAFLTQSVCLDDTTVKFEIWDTAGQERYHSLAPMYYRGAQAAIVVYDITNQVRLSAQAQPVGVGPWGAPASW